MTKIKIKVWTPKSKYFPQNLLVKILDFDFGKKDFDFGNKDTGGKLSVIPKVAHCNPGVLGP